MEIEAILRRAVDCGASDIFVAAGLPLTFKIKGEQQRTGQPYPRRTAGPLLRRCTAWRAGKATAWTEAVWTTIFPAPSAALAGSG